MSWGFSITQKHFSKDGELIGVTVTVDNGESQYMTIESYNKFLKNREKNYGKNEEFYNED
jgi:hypothetical protein